MNEETKEREEEVILRAACTHTRPEAPAAETVVQPSERCAKEIHGPSAAKWQWAGRLWLIACLLIAGWQGRRLVPYFDGLPASAATVAAKDSSPDSARGSQRRLAAADPDVRWINGLPYRLRNIEAIEKGEQVLSMDTETGGLGPQPVIQPFERTADHLRLLTFVDEHGDEQTQETTDEHPYWALEEKSWLLAKDLTPGSRVLTADGSRQTLRQTARVEHPAGIQVFNFEVADWHSYFVVAPAATTEPVLVHNANGKKYDTPEKQRQAELDAKLHMRQEDLADGLRKLHGNSLEATGSHTLYAIRDRATNKVLHIGETGDEATRKLWWINFFAKLDITAYMDPIKRVEGKNAVKKLETRYLQTFQKVFGKLPDYNFSSH